MVHDVISKISAFLTNEIHDIGRLKYLYHISLCFFFSCTNYVNDFRNNNISFFNVKLLVVLSNLSRNVKLCV